MFPRGRMPRAWPSQPPARPPARLPAHSLLPPWGSFRAGGQGPSSLFPLGPACLRPMLSPLPGRDKSSRAGSPCVSGELSSFLSGPQHILQMALISNNGAILIYIFLTPVSIC